ncbi:MAG TPA: hypothetical protein VFW65_02945 [Pseudonocardiaceae bacterium]|nr:hypothetical protein [Pseudonocardiaceae bacterium]
MSLVVMTVLVAVTSLAQIQGYVSAFPNAALRQALLVPFADNGALRVLYGYPYDIGDATGWVSWRSMSVVEIVMAVWAMVVVSGALRGEEDVGRGELALSRPQPRRRWFAAALTATAVEAVVIGAVAVAAMAAVGVPQGLMTFGNCVELGLQVVLPALLFGAVAALTSQLLGTVRGARLAGAAVLAVAFMVRAVADTGSGIGWVRWLTPLGWFEQLRPPGVPPAAALLAILAGTAILVAVCLPVLSGRDIGRGLLPGHDARSPRRALLGTAWQAAVRDELPQLGTWLVAAVACATLMGGLARTVIDFVRDNPAIARVLGRGVAVDGYVAAMFSLAQVVAALLAVALVAAARGEEATGRLEILLAMPRTRVGWLVGRVTLAAAAAALLALVAAGGLWVGAELSGERLDVGSLLMAAGNCIPVIVVTAGFAGFVFGVAPRAVASGYALVVVAYLWDAVGALFAVPAWTLNLSPFHAVARVPLEPFTAAPAVVLGLLGAALFTVGLVEFRHRDLVTG